MNGPIRILELRSVRGTGGGPEKTILLGTARTDAGRFAITVCYLRDERDTVFGIDRKYTGLPIDYREVRERGSFDPSIWRQLRALIRENAIDIVHAHEYKTDFLAWALAKAEGIVPLSTAHGWTGHSSREKWIYYPIDKRLLARFPRVIAVSSDVRHELIRHGARPDRGTTVLNGIDHQAFHRDVKRQAAIRQQLGVVEPAFVLGAVGRLEPQKRFDVLIDAFADLRRRHPSALLLIAGDGSLRDALEAQITRLDLGSSCRLLGHRNDVVELHHGFDLFVQSSDYEGTPNSVLEAMALETPVVATDAGGTAEIARDGVDGIIVRSGDAAALTAAMESAIGDPVAMAGRVESARRRVETTLSFETRMRAVEQIYVDLAARFRRASGNAVTVDAA